MADTQCASAVQYTLAKDKWQTRSACTNTCVTRYTPRRQMTVKQCLSTVQTNGKIQMTETQCTYACTTQYTPRRQKTDTQCVY